MLFCVFGILLVEPSPFGFAAGQGLLQTNFAPSKRWVKPCTRRYSCSAGPQPRSPPSEKPSAKNMVTSKCGRSPTPEPKLANDLLVLSRERGNQPGESLKGSHKGSVIRFIPSFPAEHQQDERNPKFSADSFRMVHISTCRSACGMFLGIVLLIPGVRLNAILGSKFPCIHMSAPCLLSAPAHLFHPTKDARGSSLIRDGCRALERQMRMCVKLDPIFVIQSKGNQTI